MKKYIFLTQVLLLLAFLVQAQKTYQLSFKPEVGSKYYGVTESDMSIEQNIMGQEMNTEMQYKVNMLYDVIADEGENKKLKLTYDSLKMSMEIMGKNVVMDSEGDTTKDENKVMAKLKGSSVGIVMQPDGKVLKIEGADELVEKVTSGAGEEANAIKSFVGEDALKSLIAQSFSSYPAKPIKIGESWTGTSSINTGYEILTESTYTLSKVEGDVAFINYVSKLKTAEGAKVGQQGIEVDIVLAGDIVGAFEMDVKTGMQISSTGKETLKGDASFQGQKIPMTISGDFKTQFTKK